MAVVYVLAHFDDEFFAAPLLREAHLAGLDQWFFYVGDYATPDLSLRRLAETRRLLAYLGLPPARAVHVGAGTGVVDGAFHRSLPVAFAALKRAVDAVGPIERFITTAYEGGHMDHDCCAVLTLELARAQATPVEQFALYNSRGLPHPLFRAAAPIAENGPVRRLPLSLAQVVKWISGVRFFPSQAKTWLGLTPTTVWSLAQRGFGVQRLDSRRARERPHEGALLYEQRFGVTYGEVRAAQDDFLAGAMASAAGPA